MMEKGGAVTPIGDPPNIIVASNPTVIANVRIFQMCFILFANIQLEFCKFDLDRVLISLHSLLTWRLELFWL